MVEGDLVYLERTDDSKGSAILSKPLVPGGRIVTGGAQFKDRIEVNDVIGKGLRDVVTSKRGREYRIQEPTLAEYTTLSPRVVTPVGIFPFPSSLNANCMVCNEQIYPQDANLIVSLLDLHPTAPSADNDTGAARLEIFEAGTGHGALTLHLARAIYGANTPAPRLPPSTKPTKVSDTPSDCVTGLTAEESTSEEGDVYEQWRANRRAVVHTLDNSAKHSAHAQNVARSFRRGMYFPHIDFHVGHIGEYLSSRLASNGNEPIFAHVILDLPDTHQYLEIVGRALNPNGSLITWNPSVTQVIKCMETVKEQKLPFYLEKVLEVGAAVGSGGREWDVRRVKTRASLKAETLAAQEPVVAEQDASGDEPTTIYQSGTYEMENDEISHTNDGLVPKLPTAASGAGWEIICRPRVGIRIEGGGFIGLWRRKVGT